MRRLLIAISLWLGLVGTANAMTIEEQLLASLRAQGYEIVEEGYTFLGRLRIVATNGELRRELVVNPGTGEILRDYAVLLPRVASGDTSTSRSGSGSGNATSTVPKPTIGLASGAAGSGGKTPTVTAGVAGTDLERGDGNEALSGVATGGLMLDPVLPLEAAGQ